VLTEDSRVVLPTPYDPPDSPRYELRRGSWRDNHPGRKEIEETLPSNFFELFSPEEVRWDLEYSLYRFRDGSFFVPALGTELVNGSYDQDDLEDGRSTFQFELTHPDFELGVSGVRISVLLSGNNPDIHQLGLWEGLLQDHERFLAVTRALTETLTEDFPQARGKHLIYAIAADDITAREVSFNRDNGLRGDIVNEMGLRYHRTSNQDTLLIKSSLHLSDRSAFDRPDLNLVAPSRYHYANFGERVITMVFVGFYRTLGLGREFSDPQPANNTSGRAKTRIRDIITGNDQFTSLGQVGEDRPYSLLVINNEPVFND